MQSSTALFALGFLALSGTHMHADELMVLGTASSFAVLGASTVTNTGPSVLTGSLGLYPGTSVTGFPPGIVTGGSTYINNGVAQTAEADALTGFNDLALLPTSANLTGQDLGGKLLTPGVYTFDSSAQLTGALTLDFGGMGGKSFVFQTGSTLTTASASSVTIIGEAANDSVYWMVGSSATLGTTTAFEGYIVAAQSITLTTGATIACGGAYALNAAVTLDTNTIGGGCFVDSTGPTGPTGPNSVAATPEPGSFGLLAAGLLSVAGAVRRRLAI